MQRSGWRLLAAVCLTVIGLADQATAQSGSRRGSGSRPAASRSSAGAAATVPGPGGASDGSSAAGYPRQFATGKSTPIALEGFCPVCLLNSREWVKGDSRFREVFDGQAYFFPDQRQLEIFRAAPQRYAPALGGDCVVHFASTGKRTRGDLRYGILHDDRLLFFANAEHKRAFVEDPSSFIDADLALGGECAVCRVELERRVAGKPELAVIHNGLRYLFPAAQHRERFLANTLQYVRASQVSDGSQGQWLARTTADGGETSASPVSQRAGSGARAADSSGSSTRGSDRRSGQRKANPIAMSGFCPVSILDTERWVRGLAEHGAVLDGQTYLFAGKPQRRKFLANPAKYVPALGGDCTVCLAEKGKRVPGSVYHAVFHNRRLYLFPGQEQKETFKSDPQKYASIDLALGGICAVCKLEMGEDVPGKPAWTTWFQGMRYQFPGEEQQKMFLSDPQKYQAVAKQVRQRGSRTGGRTRVDPGWRPKSGSGGSAASGTR